MESEMEPIIVRKLLDACKLLIGKKLHLIFLRSAKITYIDSIFSFKISTYIFNKSSH
jgi:hypothetical protein